MTDYAHGTIARYKLGKCRCAECTIANREYTRACYLRKRMAEWGGADPFTVPADECRAHLAFLRSRGVGLRRITELTGTSRSVLYKIASGRRRRVRYETHDRIMGVCTDDKAPGRWAS